MCVCVCVCVYGRRPPSPPPTCWAWSACYADMASRQRWHSVCVGMQVKNVGTLFSKAARWGRRIRVRRINKKMKLARTSTYLTRRVSPTGTRMVRAGAFALFVPLAEAAGTVIMVLLHASCHGLVLSVV